MMDLNWKPIDEFPGYSVNMSRPGVKRVSTGRLLKGSRRYENGDVYYQLIKNGKIKKRSWSSLVYSVENQNLKGDWVEIKGWSPYLINTDFRNPSIIDGSTGRVLRKHFRDTHDDQALYFWLKQDGKSCYKSWLFLVKQAGLY